MEYCISRINKRLSPESIIHIDPWFLVAADVSLPGNSIKWLWELQRRWYAQTDQTQVNTYVGILYS